MDSQLSSELNAIQDELIEILHDIHSHPELSLKEERTSKLVAKKLKEYGLDVTEGVGHYGVVGTLKSNQSGNHSIGLRADMDALHLTEQTDLSYSSKIPEAMHACGHDGHTVMLLGAAKYLAEHRDSFCGTAHFIFQPAEENLQGAYNMIKDKLFERFPVDATYGLHNTTNMEVGKFGIRSGPMMAASDRWVVTFSGTGGHGGLQPHLATDVTILQAQFIMALQTIVSRNIASTDSAVVSVGAIEGGSFDALAVMPSKLRIGGTTRSFIKSVRDTVERRMKEITDGLAQTFGCTVEVEYCRSGIPLVNHVKETMRAMNAAESLVGKESVDGNMIPITAAEDFAYMLEEKPGAYMMIGNGKKSGPIHSPTYVFNKENIPFGVGYWIKLIQQELQN
ncbi:unnamed protein product [Adineta steineri]|uniref:Amidohydrolase n=1 Tax=Adineta steineri TaxID=433720 RepID=A0A815E4U6_9BILA|nr:unnamed protein product [Adineta steineri]CAF3685338.1 unnamed protein product [Adineta steineri]